MIKPTLAALVIFSSLTLHAATMNLAGKWQLQLDPKDKGIAARIWEKPLPDSIKLPGSLPEQGFGDDITLDTKWTGSMNDRTFFTAPEYEKYRQPGNLKVPFWLQPEKYYAGAAWFQRELEIPQSWQNQRVVLALERPHWETRVWVDGKVFGTNDSLSTPHEYDLGQLAPGKHTLTIRVDNRRIVDVGENSHSISDNTQGNWNGIVGDISLRATPTVWIEDLQVYPNLTTKSTTVRGKIGNASGAAGGGKLSFSLNGKPVTALDATWATNGGNFSCEIPFGDNAELWDEFHPSLQTLTATLGANERKVVFGLREIAAQGTQFTINGRKTFIRGTLECCIFPKTGHPPTDLESWQRIIRIAKSCGLNLIRFHSWCPPEAAFQAADEMGFYFQVEIASWANQSTTLGDGKPVDDWLYAEAARILQAYGNHPSFVLMPYGNEPDGKNSSAWLAKWVTHWKAADARRLYTSGSGWPQLPENQFHVTPDPRIQGWGEELKSRINARPPETTTDYRSYISQRSVPVISHEIGQWCVYPNFGEIPKYTGYLKPKNFEIFRDRLEASGLGALAKQFLLASGKLQALCYKEDIESALRTPGMGGFELLDLHDFPGQGTALVGVLDPFWEEKGYITAKEFSRFCSSTVPLARLAKRVFTTDEKLEAEIEVANFSSQPMANAVAEWKLVTDGGKILARGQLPAKDLPVDNGLALGSISADLKNAPSPARLKLVVGLAGTKFENDWDVWVYPAAAPVKTAPDVLVTAKFDDAAQSFLQSGGKVLLTIPASQVRNFDQDRVKLGFSSIFWNTAWTGRQAPTTLGILCDPKHPALAEFPTDFCSDWQWWYLIHRAGALRLDVLPKAVAPVVRVIDDWVTARPLGLVVEGKVGAGKIVICGFDLTEDALTDPVSRQMRASLVDYLGSKKCRPAVELSVEQINNLALEPADGRLHGVVSIKASSEQDGYAAQNALDGDLETFWHSSWDSDPIPAFPHELVIEFNAPKRLAGFTALPRQDGNHNGWIKDFAFYASNDGVNWGEPVAKGIFAEDEKLKTVKFAAPVTARFVKLVALSGYADGPWSSLTEFNVIDAGK